VICFPFWNSRRKWSPTVDRPAEDIEGERAGDTGSKQAARHDKGLPAVKAPAFGDRRKSILEDLAILTRRSCDNEDLGVKLENHALRILEGEA